MGVGRGRGRAKRKKVSKNGVQTSTETVRLIRDGENRLWRWGKKETIIPIATLSPPE